MVAGFVVNKIGESQGWDPRMTAVLGMAAGFGAGSLVSAGAAAGSSVAASEAASVAGSTATSVNPHGIANAAGSMGVSAATGTATSGADLAMHRAFNPITGSPTYLSDGSTWTNNTYWADTPSYFGQPGMRTGLSARPTGDAALTGRFKPNQFDVSGNGPRYQKDNMGNVVKSTFQDELGNYVDGWKTRPTDANGKETGFSPLENLGVSMVKTLTTELPQKRMSGGGGGGGGGGPLMAAYNGGGGASQKAQTWGFGGQQGGYNPQGIA
jgi:hypothetical protein